MGSIYLHRKNLTRLDAGHPWIYANEVTKTTDSPRAGDIVDIRDYKSRFLGRGYFNPHSQIVVRRLTRAHEEINEEFFRRRLEAAAALRRQKRFCRLVYSEADFLPGLIVDRYDSALVVQILTLGIEVRKEMLLTILRDLFHPEIIIERSDVVSRKLEGLSPTKGILWPAVTPLPDSHPIQMEVNGLVFSVDLVAGQKTGFFLDQQENYRRVAELVSSTRSEKESFRVLDCFTYQGGFALHAAKAGASEVIGVEMSEEAIEVARQNAKRNDLSERCKWICANAFDFLAAASKGKTDDKKADPFSLIILDPPSFTRTRQSVEAALRGYKEIHLRALKLLKPGGFLATFCCSHHVDGELFKRMIVEAAADAQRDLRLIQTLTQSSDHPILPAVPETEYLKGFILQVVE